MRSKTPVPWAEPVGDRWLKTILAFPISPVNFPQLQVEILLSPADGPFLSIVGPVMPRSTSTWRYVRFLYRLGICERQEIIEHVRKTGKLSLNDYTIQDCGRLDGWKPIPAGREDARIRAVRAVDESIRAAIVHICQYPQFVGWHNRYLLDQAVACETEGLASLETAENIRRYVGANGVGHDI